VKGRKRHIVVDTQGWLLAVVVHPANIQDRVGAQLVLGRLRGRFPRLQRIWADGAYAGKLVRWAKRIDRHDWVDATTISTQPNFLNIL
jgi:hypothetical protein